MSKFECTRLENDSCVDILCAFDTSRPNEWRDLLLFMCGNKEWCAKSMSADSIFLPIPEVVVYIAVYISSLSYGFYQAYLAGNGIYLLLWIRFAEHSLHSITTIFADFVNEQTELADGWLWLNRKRDDIDYEWEAFKSHTTKYAYWLICHILLTEIVRFVAPKVSDRCHSWSFRGFSNTYIFSFSALENTIHACGHRHFLCSDQLQSICHQNDSCNASELLLHTPHSPSLHLAADHFLAAHNEHDEAVERARSATARFARFGIVRSDCVLLLDGASPSQFHIGLPRWIRSSFAVRVRR